jgi:hypothetical protein
MSTPLRPQEARVPLGLNYYHVDVFSSKPLSGNGVTVFRLREALPTAVMQEPEGRDFCLEIQPTVLSLTGEVWLVLIAILVVSSAAIGNATEFERAASPNRIFDVNHGFHFFDPPGESNAPSLPRKGGGTLKSSTYS